MNNLVAAGLLGGVAFFGIAFVVAILALAFGTIVMIIRCATNDQLSKGQKTWWILAQLLLFPSAIIYMIVVEKSLFWKSVGTITLLFLLGMIAIALCAPRPAKAADGAPSTGFEAKLSSLEDQVKRLHDTPGVSQDDKLCYAMVSFSISGIRLGLFTHKAPESVFAQMADSLQNLIKTNILNQGKNCQDWNSQVAALVTKENKGATTLTGRIKANSANLDELIKTSDPNSQISLCYNLANLSMATMTLDLTTGNISETKLTPLIDDYDQLIKTNTLAQGSNCFDWVNRANAALK